MAPYIVDNRSTVLPTMNPHKLETPPKYPNNDLGSVYTHYNNAEKKNVATPNKLPKRS